jgi:hypothetical protein
MLEFCPDPGQNLEPGQTLFMHSAFGSYGLAVPKGPTLFFFMYVYHKVKRSLTFDIF